MKKDDIMPFAASWMDLEIIILSEESQRKTNIVLLICGIFKKKIQMNLFRKIETLTDIENKLTVTKGKSSRGINQKFGINIYTQLYIKQANNRGYCTA